MNTKELFTLDTNIIIYYLKGKKVVVDAIQELVASAADFYISAITLAELLSFPNLTKKEERNIFDFISFINVVPVNEQIAIEAANVSRREGLCLGDSIVLATALVSQSKLITCDKKHFQKVKSLEVKLIKI